MENIAGSIVVSLLLIQNQIKIYHWQTQSYARHKASDQLFEALIGKIDKFVEAMQGSWGVRLQLPAQLDLPLMNVNDDQMVEILQMFKQYLSQDLPELLRDEDTDLFNLRDEILAKVNVTLYLFTFQK